MRTLKGLLLQMKLGTSDERILAEEEIVKLFEDEKSRALKLVEALRWAKAEYWNRCYEGGTVQAVTLGEFDRRIDKALSAYSTDSGDGEKS